MLDNPNRKCFLTKEELKKLLKTRLSAKIIGKSAGVSANAILYWAHKYKLPITPSYGRVKDIRGKRFGRLVVVKMVGDIDNNGARKWLCRCDCGSEKIVVGSTLRYGATKSCGCISFERNFKGYGKLSKSYWNRIMKGAKKRNLKMALTIKDAWDLFQKQKGKCAVSGMPIHITTDYTNQHNEHTASFDRIDNKIGYVLGNVQWVHRDINMMRRTMSIEEFVSICRKVSSYARHKTSNR